MIIINKKFIFIKILQIFYELCLSIIGFFIINYENVHLLIFLQISISLNFIEQITGVLAVRNYLRKFGHIFTDDIDYYRWKNRYDIMLLKKMIYFVRIIGNSISIILILKYFKDITCVYYKIYLYHFVVQTGFMYAYGLCYIINSLYFFMENDENFLEIKKIGKIKEDCPICLDSNDKEWGELYCKHKFHYICVYRWIHLKNTCPICRNNL